MTSRRPAVALAVLAAAFAALHAVLVVPVHGFLLSDTTGYLANARWLAGKAGDTWQGPSSFYNPLWSLLVAPLWVVFSLPRDVQVGALVLNGGLAVAILPASYVLARRVFGLPEVPAIAAAAAAAAYPAVVLLAGYEWAEPLYQLLFVGFVLAVAARRWVAVGALAAALNATHPRGLGVAAVAAAYLAVVAWRDRRALLGLGALVVGFVLTRVIDAALLDAIYGARSAAVEGDVLGRLTDPQLLWGAVKATVGQLWYLSVASFGLVPLGALWLALNRRVARPVALVTLAAGLATLAASALEMSDGTRVDHMVYGRYVEGAVPVFLVAGCAAVVAWRHALPRLLAVLAGGAALVALALVVVRGGGAFTGDVMPLNVSGILLWRRSISQVEVLRVTLLALAVTAAVFLVGRWRPAVGIGLAAVVFAGSAVSVQARTLDPFDDTFAGMTRISEVVRSLPRGSIGIDRRWYDPEAANFYQLELADRGVRFGRPPATTYLIAGVRRPPVPGAVRVFVERGLYRQGLWVRPGAQQRRVLAGGDVLPFGALPEGARSQRVRADVPATVGRGSTTKVVVHVTNTGDSAGWIPFGAVPGQVKHTIRLGGRWFDAQGTQRAGQLAELDRAVLPGGSVAVTLPLVAPEAPGRYTVRLGLLEEGVSWFPGDLTVTVVVR